MKLTRFAEPVHLRRVRALICDMCEHGGGLNRHERSQASMSDREDSTPSYDALLSDLISLSFDDKTATKAATALDFVIDGDVASLRTLLHSDSNNIHINARHPISGRSLLHDACAEGKKDLVKFLLEETEADLMLRTMLVNALWLLLLTRARILTRLE